MTEIEQLKADLAALEAASDVYDKEFGYRLAFCIETIEKLKQRIAALEVEPTEIEQLKADLKTLEAASCIYDKELEYTPAFCFETIQKLKQRIAALEAEQGDPWAEAKDAVCRWLHITDPHTLCPVVAKYARHLEDKLAKRPVLESADHLREKLAELITILNAIPPACPEALALVQVRIDSVKREMQGNA